MAVSLPSEQDKAIQELFALVKELKTDVQRLQQRVPQTPYPVGGVQALTTTNKGDASAPGSIGP